MVIFFIKMFIELLVLFVGIGILTNLFFIYIPQNKLEKLIKTKGIKSNLYGVILASITPLCTCSTIPLMLNFIKANVSFSTVITFLVASPLINPIILVMLWSLISFKVAIIYFVTIFVLSLVFGIILEKIGAEKLIKSHIKRETYSSHHHENEIIIKKSFLQNLFIATIDSIKDLTSIIIYIFIGTFIGAIVYALVPRDNIVDIVGHNSIFSVMISSIVAIPFYIRIESAIPIGLSFLHKGMSLGAMVAFIIGGSGMAIPEMTMLSAIFKKRLVIYIMLIIFITASLTGYILNII